jgi:hypothetical protein
MIDRIKKATETIEQGTRLHKLWGLTVEQYAQGKLKDHSKGNTLKGEELKNISQFNPQLKLQFKERINTISMPFN